MNKQNRIKFDQLVASFKITVEEKSQLVTFIEEACNDAYQDGVDAQNYNQAVDY